MMNDTFGIRYYALSGLIVVLITFRPGLHPGFTNVALSGLMKIPTCIHSLVGAVFGRDPGSGQNASVGS